MSPPAGPASGPRLRPPSAVLRDLAPALALVLLLLFAWMASSVSGRHGPAADEPLHLAAGYTYWTRNDYRLQPENGNLPQRWAALPLVWAGFSFPQTTDPAWARADVAEVGFHFLFTSGNNTARILLLSRTMMALLGAACGALVFLWSRSLFGPLGGLVSVVLFAFCPSLLAHAGLATSDMAAALGFAAALLACWRLLHRVSAGRIAAAGLACGALALCKFSAPLILPVAVLLAVLRLSRRPRLAVRLGRRTLRLGRGRAALALAAAGLLVAAVAAGVIWAAYGFRASAVPGVPAGQEHFNQSWPTVLLDNPFPMAGAAEKLSAHERALMTPGLLQGAIRLGLRAHLLPDAWLYGLAHTLRFALWRPAFLMGRYATTGWAWFFPAAFVLKTPPATLAALGLAAALIAVRTRRLGGRLLYRMSPLLVFIAVYGAAAVTGHLNIGQRHLLPLYPLLYVCAGALALGPSARSPGAWYPALIAALLGAGAADSLAARPNYLAYFSPLAGNPDHAYRLLVDSSLDWGQDLPALSAWLRAHQGREERVYLSYFGADDPISEGIRATRLADASFDFRARQVLPVMRGGLYCIGATQFQQVYTEVRHGWNRGHEGRLRALEDWLAHTRIQGLDTSVGPDGRPVPRALLLSNLDALENLRFGRLCAGLRGREPDAVIGRSILVFRLADADLLRLESGPAPWAP